MYLISGKEWLKKKKAKGKSKGSKEMKTSLPAVSPGGDKERKFDNKDSMDKLQEMLAAKRKELESQALLTRETKENGETGEEAAKTGIIVDLLLICNRKTLMFRAFSLGNKI